MEDNSTSQENSQSQNSELYRDFKGLWIPREIWLNLKLLPLEKCLWAEIHSLHSRKKKGCFASREYLCKFFGVTDRYIRKMLLKLKGMNLVEDVSFDGREKVIRAKVPPETFGDEFQAERNYSSRQRGTTVPPCQEPQFPSNPSRDSITSYNKEDNKEYKNNAQTPASQSSKQRFDFSFSLQSKTFEGITEKDISAWKECYPSINIRQEIAKAEEWIKSNPTKSRKKLWRKFLTGWFQRANDAKENKASWKEAARVSAGSNRKDSHLRIDQDDKPSGWKPADAIR